MEIKTQTRLCLYFVVIVFFILFVTAILMSILALFLIQNGLFNVHSKGLISPLIILLIISIPIGTVVSFFVGVKIMEPITKLSEASKEVAKGDFSVRVSEKSSLIEIKEMTHNFNRMVDELSSIETLQNDFVVNVSHEFKTPIASIEGYATLLQEKDLSEEEKDEYITMILESSRQLSSLSGNILNLSKLENQEILPKDNEFRLDEQIRQAILLLEKEWTQKKINMEIDLTKIEYRGDDTLLMQVWVNILSNAVKFTDHGGTISIKSFPEDDRVIIKISDTGCGIPNEISHKIFDKFYQGDTSRKSQGNGLGLSLTKRILDLTGGSISVESEPDKGSTFIVSLPVNK